MTDEDLLTKNYDYDLPKSQIAKHPISPRDMAKLLVYNRAEDKITHTIFRNILDFLPPCNVIINDTKVIKARIFGKKESGGSIELLLNRPLADNKFLVLIKGKVLEGTKLFFKDGLVAEVLELSSDGSREVIFFKDDKVLDFMQVISIFNDIGHIPLPPYMKRGDMAEDEKDFQKCIWLRKSGSLLVLLIGSLSLLQKELFGKFKGGRH